MNFVGTAAQIIGVFMLSTRATRPVVAFLVMTVGSCLWALIGLQRQDWSIMAINLAFTASNLIGIWRWLRG